MAQRRFTIRSRSLWWVTTLPAVVLIVCFTGGPMAALLAQSSVQTLAFTLQDPYVRHVIEFTFEQALLSTLLSLLLAIPVARALARRQFFGKTLLLRLFGLSLVLPVIVAVSGIVTVYGRQGWFNQLLEFFGLPAWTHLYGLPGILLAHVFFNMPLCARLLLQSLDSIPAENWRLSNQLGMRSWQIFRFIEWPTIRPQLLSLVSLVFMLCFTSFATVMALGGGPKSTTLEVAIYQALRDNFDMATASILALLQLLISLVLLIPNQYFSKIIPSNPQCRNSHLRADRLHLSCRVSDAIFLLLAMGIYLPPLIAIVISGINPTLLYSLTEPSLWQALLTTLKIAFGAGISSCILAILLLLGVRHLRIRLHSKFRASLLESLGSVILVIPTVVLSTGIFILLMAHVDVFSIGLWLVLIVNALLALPYMLRTLNTPMQLVVQRDDKLCDSLGIFGWRRLRQIEWPQLRRPLAVGLSLSMILSAGDLGAIAMFGSDEFKTLPYLLYLQLTNYQSQQSAVTALVLLILCLLLFWGIEKGLGGRDVKHKSTSL